MELWNHEWIFLIEEKKVSLSRHLDFCVFGELRKFEICDPIINITKH